MSLFPPTVILRHVRENLKKCSLRGLETRPEMQFFSYPLNDLPRVESYVLLTIDAPPLTKEDCSRGLFLIDGTWRYAAVMENYVKKNIELTARSIPGGFVTAYPRKQTECADPEKGLASIEALYIAYWILGRPSREGLLDNYYWKDSFLKINQERFASLSAT